jgi:hypothetical protein
MNAPDITIKSYIEEASSFTFLPWFSSIALSMKKKPE